MNNMIPILANILEKAKNKVDGDDRTIIIQALASIKKLGEIDEDSPGAEQAIHRVMDELTKAVKTIKDK